MLPCRSIGQALGPWGGNCEGLDCLSEDSGSSHLKYCFSCTQGLSPTPAGSTYSSHPATTATCSCSPPTAGCSPGLMTGGPSWIASGSAEWTLASTGPWPRLLHRVDGALSNHKPWEALCCCSWSKAVRHPGLVAGCPRLGATARSTEDVVGGLAALGSAAQGGPCLGLQSISIGLGSARKASARWSLGGVQQEQMGMSQMGMSPYFSNPEPLFPACPSAQHSHGVSLK